MARPGLEPVGTASQAFVTKAAKGKSHEEDAAIGIKAFCDQLPTPGDADADDTPRRPVS